MDDENFKYLAKTADPSKLQLILYPTEQCNFRCVYCYEDFSQGKMPPPIVEGVKKLIENRIKTIRSLHLSWFGGEPLTAKKIVYDICEFSKKLCEASDIVFDGSITTNGYLLDLPTATNLVRLNQRSFQISLDGLGASHDKTRPLMSGGGTFDRIWKNLIGIKNSQLDIKILIRLHLNPENLDSMEELSTSIMKCFLSDPRFSVAIKPIGDWGGPNKGKIQYLKGRSKAEAVDRIYKLLNKDRIIDTEPSLYVCYASKPNSLAIRSDGRVQKCTVALKSDSNTVGKINTDGSISVNEKIKLWMKGYENGDLSLLSCPASHIERMQGAKKDTSDKIEIISL